MIVCQGEEGVEHVREALGGEHVKYIFCTNVNIQHTTTSCCKMVFQEVTIGELGKKGTQDLTVLFLITSSKYAIISK